MSESSDTSTNAAAVESESASVSKPASAPAKAKGQSGVHGRLWELLAFGLLYALAVVGFVYLASESSAAVDYWQLLVGIVAVIALFAGWSRTRRGFFGYLITTLLHWGALILVLYLLLLHSGHLNLDVQSAGMLLIYVLGLGCLLAGIHLDIRMLILGAYLIGGGLLMQGWIDTGAIDTKLVEGYLSHDVAVLIGAAVIAFVLTFFFGLFSPKRAR
ncbi:hypothetical protein Thimo_3258 [Thioflavicoccus mobilis 8321]|uniref:Uncharacterized protein n=1 Tax=Thioflavicoccus mobilis 8321 TaxID=765912 RepID=L0H148_9GAMM|nr:hypothetical protein [Thioflavicoccus mobilis]AGA91936.1 hypothetical protein Thimo_3258 [Thioflavicoccus mobilis 8321]